MGHRPDALESGRAGPVLLGRSLITEIRWKDRISRPESANDYRIIRSNRTKKPRRWLSFLGSLTLAAIFTAGIIYMMMTLAGYFEPKVKPGDSRDGGRAGGRGREHHRSSSSSGPGPSRPSARSAPSTRSPSRRRSGAGQGSEDQGGAVGEGGRGARRARRCRPPARLRQAKAAESGATAKLNQARIDVERANRLRAVNSVSQQELEQANTSFLSAKAELERSEHAVNEAQILLGYASLHAPITGIVIDKKVNSGDTVSPGQTLLTMYDRTRMQMVATVRESLAMGLEAGQQVAARLDSLGLDCHATISEIVPEAQAESRSFQVKVIGPCPPNIYSGMFGRIFIPLGDEDVLVIPPRAVRRVGQLEMVTVVEDGAGAGMSSSSAASCRNVARSSRGSGRRARRRAAAGFGPGGTVMSRARARSRPIPVHGKHDFLNGIVHQFLDTNFSIILIIVSLLIGLAALFVTPRGGSADRRAH